MLVEGEQTMKLDDLTRLLGVPQLKTVEDLTRAMGVWKAHMISARRTEDLERAVVLSQAKERLKKMIANKTATYCQICGIVIHRKSRYCSMHHNIVRYYPRSLRKPQRQRS